MELRIISEYLLRTGVCAVDTTTEWSQDVTIEDKNLMSSEENHSTLHPFRSNGMVSSASTVACSTPSPSQSSLALVVTPPPSGLVGTPQALGIPAGNNALQLRPSEACIPCEICGRRFRSVADVRSHIAAIHLKNSEDPERRFQCEFCPFRAYTKTSIRQHMFLHTGEVPYKCDLCSYGARQKFHLDRHRQKVHGMAPTPKRGRFPGRPSSELSILPVGPSASPPDNGSGGHNGHSSDPEMPVFPPVFPSMLDQIRLDPTAMNLASNLFNSESYIKNLTTIDDDYKHNINNNHNNHKYYIHNNYYYYNSYDCIDSNYYNYS
ncbi:zinc finger protein 335 [Galendromus occidentalis]|uniref:Zinc finger protein 335 n=1 Tax=Galendromus occidentalis TaxID=34638 RepID=A0AAJ7SGP2_9ACAR|nr:zinc finger protein 335 [Galendromus occidentalis]